MTTTTATLVAEHTARFSARHLDGHSVGSGVGLWLLLALLAPLTEGDARRRLEAELGTDADDAARRAAKLLGDLHPAVKTAIALWNRPELLTSDFDHWIDSLAPGLEHGPMPDQAHANAWAHRHTLGMVPRFPVLIGADTAILLASAVATDVTWDAPFTTIDADHLGGTFGSSITQALRADDRHMQVLADTDAAGIVAVHAADATTALRVMSVIGPPDATTEQLHLATHQVSRLLAGDDRRAGWVDLFDLELGPGHAWTLTEDRVMRPVRADPIQVVRTTMAAWRAAGDHDLSGDPGIAETSAVVARFMDDPRGRTVMAARQAAMAEFTREGFRAAALTSMAAGGNSPREEVEQRRRIAEVRFNRPYAVLATALGPRDRVSSWTGVPVFSAWVEEVEDTPAVDQRQAADERRAEMRSRSAGVEG